MKSLILLSHGSRLAASNQEMMVLAENMADLADNTFVQIRCAFLQFARPTFEAVVDELVAAQVDHIVVLPLFLSSGSHVQEDVPELFAAARRTHPHLQLTLTAHLGGTKDLAAFLLNSIPNQSP